MLYPPKVEEQVQTKPKALSVSLWYILYSLSIAMAKKSLHYYIVG